MDVTGTRSRTTDPPLSSVGATTTRDRRGVAPPVIRSCVILFIPTKQKVLSVVRNANPHRHCRNWVRTTVSVVRNSEDFEPRLRCLERDTLTMIFKQIGSTFSDSNDTFASSPITVVGPLESLPTLGRNWTGMIHTDTRNSTSLSRYRLYIPVRNHRTVYIPDGNCLTWGIRFLTGSVPTQTRRIRAGRWNGLSSARSRPTATVDTACRPALFTRSWLPPDSN